MLKLSPLSAHRQCHAPVALFQLSVGYDDGGAAQGWSRYGDTQIDRSRDCVSTLDKPVQSLMPSVLNECISILEPGKLSWYSV